MVSLVSYAYLRELLNHQLDTLVMWVDPKVGVLLVYLFLYLVSGVGNYVQLNLLVSYLIKKPARQFTIVWSMMAVLYLGLTLMHLKFDHFGMMQEKIVKYQRSLR
jgi:hypothetical protein